MTASKDASKVPAPTKAKSKKTEKSEEEALLDGLMSEIEEDLRDEEIAKIWKQYGNLIIAVIVVGIVSVIGWQLWKQNQDAKQAELTRQYEVASNLVRDGKFDEAMTAYAAVADGHRANAGWGGAWTSARSRTATGSPCARATARIAHCKPPGSSMAATALNSKLSRNWNRKRFPMRGTAG